MKPELFTRIDDSIKSGKTAFILDFNTNDRQICIDDNIYPQSIQFALAEYLGKRGYHIGIYSQGIGLHQLNTAKSTATGSNPFNMSNIHSLNLLTPVLRRKDIKSALIIQYSDLLAPHSEGSAFLQPEQQILLETLHRWGADDDIRAAQNIIILISYEGSVNSLLTKSGVYTPIQVSLPSKESRKEFIDFINGVKKSGTRKYADLEEAISDDEFVRITNGLRLIDLEALYKSKTDGKISRKDVQTMKANTIRDIAGGLVEVVAPEEGFESIAGLDNVKEYFMLLRWMFQNGSPSMPYAMILAGVPGTGKSKLCGTLAKELDIPLLILRNLHGPYVGQSEANLERVLKVVDSMSPCIVVIEELDQSIGRRNTSGASGDSGTTDRMSQRFWEALGTNKNRGRTLWIGTSNRPDILDSAMLDRFQVIIPFLHPTPFEVVQLLPVLSSQVCRKLADDVNPEEIANLENLYLPTVRGLNEIITSASQRADYESSSVNSIINHRHILAAARDFKITYDAIQHEYIALKAIEMVSFTSLLPWMSFNGLRKNAQIPAYLQTIVDIDTGYVDTKKLSERIRTLEQELYHKRMTR
jgi:AAA+ superfamily predicted ATPase